MEWKIVWNGRRILVWNMEDAQNGMEWKIRKMERKLVFHTSIVTAYIKTCNK